MKKFFSLIILLIISLSLYAQRDIKTFNGIGRTAIISMLGTPLPNMDYDDYPGTTILNYSGIRICIDDETNSLVGADITSSAYCILSDCISGGIKVGDTFQKLQSYDFVNSVYGRGKSGNALTVVKAGYYMAYKEEFQFFFFQVNNGIITGIEMGTAEDMPYPNYDFSNRLW